jgi:putative PIG3 family NAD(P)H quinone oxidoreductase
MNCLVTMKAVVIKSFGNVEGLEVQDIDMLPEPIGNEVRVRVRAAALNRADILQRLGRYLAPSGFPQTIPGLEFAGEVDSIGPDARQWKIGERVFGITGGGAQAEYLNVPENHLAGVPEHLDWAAAGAVPEVFITAYDALFTCAGLKAGESLLVHAAGSGVGTAAIQLAWAAGARVFGTARTADKLERAKHYGLSESIVVTDQPADIVEPIRRWTNGDGVNVVLDLVGAAYLEANLASLARRGRMVLVGTTSGSKGTLDYSVVMSKRLQLIGTVLRGRSAEEKAEAVRLFAEQVVPLLDNGSVKPVIDSTYNVADVRKAHLRLESNQTFGKVVLLF